VGLASRKKSQKKGFEGVFAYAEMRYVPRNGSEGGKSVAQGRERTKEQLYREAKRLGVKGRSKMNKGQLKAAVDRRG
jgi:hypothetical protein